MSVAELIEPMNQQLLVVKDELPQMLGKIILPEANSFRPMSGVIVAKGPLNHQYAVGERVCFSEWAGNAISVRGEKFTILHPMEVLCRIAPGEDLDPPA